MERVKEIAKQLGVLPKLSLGVKVQGGGVKSTGVHLVKFLAEPTVVMGKDETGKPRKEMKFIVEENDLQCHWNVPILNKEGQPNYLIERLMNIDVGEERLLEMRRQGARNYIDVRAVDELPDDEPPEEEGTLEVIENTD